MPSHLRSNRDWDLFYCHCHPGYFLEYLSPQSSIFINLHKWHIYMLQSSVYIIMENLIFSSSKEEFLLYFYMTFLYFTQRYTMQCEMKCINVQNFSQISKHSGTISYKKDKNVNKIVSVSLCLGGDKNH